ncbi:MULTISPECIES: oxidoreductase [Rhizobium]|uniref:NADP-dependent oxidoreductase domain-containing protein n=1 Tax=Rhizobium paranaense TaxID=1650438 RepID=A0A7W8XXZ2_9HYPH|nr:oxidoreductase [Rhizobium paranaense]MBB5577634.1 hypothetical protein [Rhizobium paranaense]
MGNTSNARTYKLGDKTVARIGYGAMQLAGPGVFGAPKDPDAALAVLRGAIAAGVNHIDTADFYGPHITNQLIREALYPYPDDLVIVTKVGASRGEDGSWVPAQAPADLIRGVHDNLRSLQLDVLEVVNLRVIEGTGRTPAEGSIEERFTTLAELQRQGLIRHLGLSNATASQVKEAQSIAPIVCVQNHYNLVHRADDPLVDTLAEQEIAYVPFFPLGGFSRLQSEVLDAEAHQHGLSPMQLALAWLLARSSNILLIPGTSRIEHLNENLAAAEINLATSMLSRIGQTVQKEAR